MKHWQETAKILERVERLTRAGARAALATVIRIQGSAYRRPGAKLLVEEDGRTMGGVSGGCLEGDLREVALTVLSSGTPRLRHYDTRAGDDNPFALGLGCNGSIDVLVQVAAGDEEGGVLRLVRGLLVEDSPFAIATVIGGAGAGRIMVSGEGGVFGGTLGDPARDREVAEAIRDLLATCRSQMLESGAAPAFVDVFSPPPHLLVVGAGEDAVPLVAYASDVGFRVSVVDHRPALLTTERFPSAVHLLRRRPEEGVSELPLGPRTCVILKTHSLALDRDWTERVLPSGPWYVGLLGPRTRAEEILRRVEGVAAEKVFGPVGLDIGAEGPEQIAVSIVAELLAVWRRRTPSHLREKKEGIHES